MLNLLQHTVQVMSQSNAQTDFGTPNPTYSERIASLACLIQQKALAEPIDFGKKTVRVIHKLYCMESDGSAIIESDRIVWTAKSKTLEVVGIKDGGGQGHHLEIDCIEVD